MVESSGQARRETSRRGAENGRHPGRASRHYSGYRAEAALNSSVYFLDSRQVTLAGRVGRSEFPGFAQAMTAGFHIPRNRSQNHVALCPFASLSTTQSDVLRLLFPSNDTPDRESGCISVHPRSGTHTWHGFCIHFPARAASHGISGSGTQAGSAAREVQTNPRGVTQ